MFNAIKRVGRGSIAGFIATIWVVGWFAIFHVLTVTHYAVGALVFLVAASYYFGKQSVAGGGDADVEITVKRSTYSR